MNDETIFVSESIKEKINLENFYDTSDVSKIFVEISYNDEKIKRELIDIKFTDISAEFKFVSSISDFKFIQKSFDKDTDTKINFYNNKTNVSIGSIDSFAIISKRLIVKDKNNLCTAKVIINIHNT